MADKTMAELLTEAESKGLWLWCAYQDLWFSPKRLRELQAKGRFRWGPVNWQLREPKERVEEAHKRATAAKADLDRIINEFADD